MICFTKYIPNWLNETHIRQRILAATLHQDKTPCFNKFCDDGFSRGTPRLSMQPEHALAEAQGCKTLKLGIIRHLPKQPGPGKTPVFLGRGFGESQGLGCLINRKTGKITKLDQFGLGLVHLGQL